MLRLDVTQQGPLNDLNPQINLQDFVLTMKTRHYFVKSNTFNPPLQPSGTVGSV